MSSHAEKSMALADKITAKAEATLAALDREMIAMKWPDEFRIIMWEAVAVVASSYAASLKKGTSQ